MGDVQKKLGRRIAAERELLGLSQADLAERVGVATETISRLERGVFDPSIARVESIANALDIALHDLFRFGASSSEERLMNRFLSVVARRSVREVDLALRVVEAVLESISDNVLVRGP